MKRKLPLLLFIVAICFKSEAQSYFPSNTDTHSPNNYYIAFTNATLYKSPTNVVKNAVLLIKDQKVVEAGKGIKIPKNAKVIDLKGKFIYPSFIDLYTHFGMQKPKPYDRSNPRPLYDTKREGYYWNEHIVPENNAVTKFNFNKEYKTYLESGIGVVLTHVKNGIARGTSTLVALNPHDTNATRILDSNAAQHFGFTRNVASKQVYPNSLMGMIALLRQMHYDAAWQKKGALTNTDLSLNAILKNESLPQIFETNDVLHNIRAQKIAKEFNLKYIFKGGGNEYQRIEEIKKLNTTFILPINFPDAYDVSNPLLADKVSLSDMRHWNQAPTNPSVFEKNNIPFTITTESKNVKGFRKNLQKAIQHGLSRSEALEALTTVPASILKNSKIGNLNKGAWANFMITSGDVFDKESFIYEHWIQGKSNVFITLDKVDIRGEYNLRVANNSYKLSIDGSLKKPKASIKQGKTKVSADFSYKDNWVSIHLKPSNNSYRLAASVEGNGNFSGSGYDTNGTKIKWTAVKESDFKNSKNKKKKEASKPDVLPITYPNVAYGNATIPKQQTILIKNATVWTNEAEGILKNTDVLLKGGKISKIGKNISASGAKVIDGSGKHVTPGIIDEHTHIAITGGVNEVGHNSTAEVSIQDAINSKDINIYRNLSGGVTMAQALHGSANPIGGQSAIIKLKWGLPYTELLLKDQPKFIKFALGENVKHSNRSRYENTRFPQTRMGVEQTFMSYFQKAKDYDTNKKANINQRTDIELEVLSEILNKERFITCHSYVQSEINMLMKVAEHFDFNVNTFTHILEGYKVADKMKEHGVGGSTFSDWWAYKFEVVDAIPYNGAIMHNQGVTVAFNSDDAEMSRRLNQEAAKAVKYGGVSEEDAFKFVTLNPAKLLHLDHRVGSLKVGKDADVVVWSDHPLSVYALAEKTIVEGTIYFDIEENKRKKQQISKERNKLINLMLSAKKGGEKTQPATKKKDLLYECETLLDY